MIVKMNDFDKLIFIIDGKVPFEIFANQYADRYPQATKQVTIENCEGFGYAGFVSEWLFDEDGKLVAVGHYD